MKYSELLNEENNINKLEKFAGFKIPKPGRYTIKGYPVEIEENPDDDGDDYISMEAVDRDAATGLLKELRKAKFKVKRYGNTGIVIN